MNRLEAGILVLLLSVCGAAEAGPHELTYTPISVAPGTFVVINNQGYVAVQVPLREFGTDKRYAVRYLTHTDAVGGRFGGRSVNIRHSVEPLKNPNATIGGFPAEIEVVDQRDVSIFGEDTPDPATGELYGELLVDSYIEIWVRIQVGDALVTISDYVDLRDQSVTLYPHRHSGTSKAVYSRYKDHLDLIGPQGWDKWIDYIRVIPLQ